MASDDAGLNRIENSPDSPTTIGKRNRLSIALMKDILAALQSAATILALACGAFWFFMQRPFDPIIKAEIKYKTLAPEVLVSNTDAGAGTQRDPSEKNYIRYTIKVTGVISNIGRTPVRYHCLGLDVEQPKGFPPDEPDCSDSLRTVSPGATITRTMWVSGVWNKNEETGPSITLRVGDFDKLKGTWKQELFTTDEPIELDLLSGLFRHAMPNVDEGAPSGAKAPDRAR